MSEFIEQFIVECHELVEQATDDLLFLEEQPRNRERLDSAFRAFHTLKGAAGIVDFAAMEVALHAAEDVLSAVRAGVNPMTATLIGDCLACLDQVVQWLDAVQLSGEPPADAQAASEAIVARFAMTSEPSLQNATVSADATAGPEASGLPAAAHELLTAQLALLTDETAESTPGRTLSAATITISLLRASGLAEPAGRLEQMVSHPDARRDPRALAAVIQNILHGAFDLLADTPAAQRDVADSAPRGLRVDVERIDALVQLTGELTVAKNALAYVAAQAQDGVDQQAVARQLKDQHAVLERLVGELQRSVLHMRVLPLRSVFQRFPRLVREMVVTLGKPARLVTEGDSTEADKAVVENLFEPLLHVMRNALDHGVESAEVRAAAGKPPSATILLRAAREGDRILIEVEDDGGGIDVARVRAVALQRGLVSAEALAEMSEAAVIDLIFAPGFSTAAEVTSLSGRGVGMDTVRSGVERLGGSVAIDSLPGKGTTVRFILPFTVMMNRVMTVEAGGQMFGIPMEAVVETLRLDRQSVAPIGAARAFVLRNRTLPLIDLAEALGDRGPVVSRGHAHVVVASAAGRLGGLEVDRLGEPMDVMLKPMDGLLAGMPGVAGTTLLGDGRVLIVLDIRELLLG
jgi:two-component system chemotaxis sensor kinase CheA